MIKINFIKFEKIEKEDWKKEIKPNTVKDWAIQIRKFRQKKFLVLGITIRIILFYFPEI
jgi:hypothetical protein